MNWLSNKETESLGSYITVVIFHKKYCHLIILKTFKSSFPKVCLSLRIIKLTAEDF